MPNYKMKSVFSIYLVRLVLALLLALFFFYLFSCVKPTAVSVFKEPLHLRQKKDRIKREYCAENSIPLLELRYDEDDVADQRIQEYIDKYVTHCSHSNKRDAEVQLLLSCTKSSSNKQNGKQNDSQIYPQETVDVSVGNVDKTDNTCNTVAEQLSLF